MKNQKQLSKTDEFDAYDFHQCLKLEKKWKQQLNYSDLDLIEIFKDGLTDIIPTKLVELKNTQAEKIVEIKKNILWIDKEIPEKDRYFVKIYTEQLLVIDLIDIERQISYFKRLKYLLENKDKKNNRYIRTRLDIEKALEYPLQDIVSQITPLRKYGNKLSARCPLHQEKTPSFYVYLDTNSWYCFGACQKGGNVISFIEKYFNYSFVEAVKYLTN